MNPSLPFVEEMISGWGLYPKIKARVYRPSSPQELEYLLHREGSLVARGLGRSYGDAAIAPTVVDTTALNKFLEFDTSLGSLYVEAGASIDQILRWSVPRGWFLPVVPGTKYVTLGGAFASDIHGKNHHAQGSFSDQVEEVELFTSRGELIRCSRHEKPDLFWATAGGLGLTGIILRIRLRLKPIETAYIWKRILKAPNLPAILRLFDEYQQSTYSVAWIDCLARGKNLGRSVLFLGEHLGLNQLPSHLRTQPLLVHSAPRIRIPYYFPDWTLNTLSIRTFNTLYYWFSGPENRPAVVHYDPFFFPLDKVYHWNRIYGRRGFLQYQCVVPKKDGEAILAEILGRISRSGMGSFLAVLKLFGPSDGRYLNFPMEGYTLALDFPRTSSVFFLLDELDELVDAVGGRVYLTKDARLHPKHIARQYPQWQDFVVLKNEVDPQQKWASLLSQRLQLTSSLHVYRDN
ncbi:MAG: FAD-binding oxidoreductase [Flavobacteriales bacterium]|nr:FAD-binding oxidoreductase [Flavobacteriales bacterium]MCX7769001.1 FAD-binding oxidoreductase [Flavobacteriales bacterium]MDW8410210.1 FAD-binding oxidoreductase [Flavobacteriales bacterium]